MLTILFPTRTMNNRPAHMRCSYASNQQESFFLRNSSVTRVSFLQDMLYPYRSKPRKGNGSFNLTAVTETTKTAYLVKIEGVDVRDQGLCDITVVIRCVREAYSGKVVSCCYGAAGEHDCFGSVSFAPGAV